MSEQLYRKTNVYKYTNCWKNVQFNGLDSTFFEGEYVWSDGSNTYYSNGSEHYVLDKSTRTWLPKLWNNPDVAESLSGANVWHFKGETYYSLDFSNNYKLNTSTGDWERVTWSSPSNISSFAGAYIWSDGDNAYFSKNAIQYVLDTNTNSWIQKTWNGMSSFSGDDVWFDDGHIYWNDYILDKATATWSQVTWNGLSRFSGKGIWHAGNDLYYSYGNYSNQYVYNRSLEKWVAIEEWQVLPDSEHPYGTTLGSFSASSIWTDGENIYNRAYHILEAIYNYEPATIHTSMKVKDRGGIWYPVKGISVRTHGGSEAAAIKLDTKVPCLTANGDVVIMYDADGNILAHKSDIGNVAAVTRFAMYEIRNIYTGETCPFDTSDVSAEQVSSIYVDGEGYLAYNDADDTEGENPRQMLEWSSLNEAMIDFASIAGYPRYS